MKRICRACKKEKAIEDFGTRLGKPIARCKSCKYKENKEWRRREKAKNRKYYVYYLPEEHYIGFTSNITNRMYTHKHQGNHVDDYEIIFEHKHPAAALMIESLFHFCGYNGCNYK